MTGPYYSYLSPKVESRPHAEKGECGVFCNEPIAKDEIVALWGGKILAADEVDPDMPNFTQQVLQIEDGFYLMTPSMEPSDCFNHSCSPNVGLSGQIGLIAMRDIAVGEEVCLDYAMCDGSNYDEFECTCGAPDCRHHITGDDWKRPELWDRYDGYFSPYLQRRIARLRNEVHQETGSAARR
jgi:uncharacterized protein